MKIAFVSSECVPFASTGGLGEVCGSLPSALVSLGHQVILIMPLFRQAHDAGDLQDTGLEVSIPVGLRSLRARYRFTERNGVRTYFVERDEFFDRTHLYGNGNLDYDDNFERFVFFQKAAVHLLDRIAFHADIVHAHDWQTGLIPLFLRHGIHGAGREGNERCVFTIHNLAYQGIYPASSFAHTNLPYNCFDIHGVEYYGNLSCLKGGITSADQVTTVSHTYAREIQTEAQGQGLHGILDAQGDRLAGILNGLDYRAWNPATDPHIHTHFDSHDLTGKKACRQELLAHYGLQDKVGAPVVGMVSRLVAMKGVDLVAEIMPKLMKKGVRFVLLGSGLPEYHELAQLWMQKWPEQCGCILGYRPEIAHKIYAGCDLFLMPSEIEPCGLSQLYSMRYGTVPVVHATGGLADTVIDPDQDPQRASGFSFANYDPKSFWKAVQRAMHLYDDHVAWQELQTRIMNLDYSWHQSAREYIRLYQQLLPPATPDA